MSLPVIADVFRVTWNFTATAGGMPATCANVLHVRTTSATPSEIATTIATSLGSAANDILFPQSNDWHLTSMDITPLDGSSGTFTASGLDIHGTDGGDAISQGCYVASHTTAKRGRSFRGRTYIGPVRESAQQNGVLDFTGGDVIGAWGELEDALGIDDMRLVVASYKLGSAENVTGLNIHPYLFTQRRRAFH